MDLQDLRLKIDSIDDSLIKLFEKRIAVSAEIAVYKQQHGLQVYDPVREQQKLSDISKKVKDENKAHISALYSLIFTNSTPYFPKSANVFLSKSMMFSMYFNFGNCESSASEIFFTSKYSHSPSQKVQI